MAELHFSLEGDGCWPELKEVAARGDMIVVKSPIKMALLKRGMVSGRPSVTVRIDLPDGRTVTAETSLGLLVAAAKAMSSATGAEDWPEVEVLRGEPDFVREHRRLRVALADIKYKLEKWKPRSDILDSVMAALGASTAPESPPPSPGTEVDRQ